MNILRRDSGGIYRFELTESEFEKMRDEYNGLCVSCGKEIVGGVEPDARKYHCEHCEKLTVFGVENLLMQGGIKIVESENV
ncbi:hypothetical protein phi1422_0027 [Bdellovibrio phage phi1422]|uniref:hypothetical protein n=1 Tax=Bdellovibrio phage phi1422 TaxID=1127515 RepID=UPI0002536D4F|nr:hypothetical protein F395_gp27 [Bdellovibrio phage phi1422]AFC22547.1 hypothetical protein phi1422_0027 [Bdellovibrio phage phi1422]